MVDLASDWGFQPFGTAQSYPGGSHNDGPGKRAQKSDKRRQRQLEEMVSGVVRLSPAGTCISRLMHRWLLHCVAVSHRSCSILDSGAPVGAGTSGSKQQLKQAAAEPGSRAGPSAAVNTAASPAAADAKHTAAGGTALAEHLAKPAGDEPQRGRGKKARLAAAATMAPAAMLATDGSIAGQATQPRQSAALPVSRQQDPGKKRRNRNKFKQDTDLSMAEIAAAQRPSSAAAAQASAPDAMPRTEPQSSPGTRDAAQQAAAADSLRREGAQPGQQRQRSSGGAAAAPQQQQGPQRQAAEPPAAGQPKRKKRKRQQEQGQAGKPAADAAPAAKPSAAAQSSATPTPAAQSAAAAAAAAVAPAAAPPLKAAGGSKLLDRMRGKLQGGRFRWLNEQLYTSTGGEALRMMQVRGLSVFRRLGSRWLEALMTMCSW